MNYNFFSALNINIRSELQGNNSGKIVEYGPFEPRSMWTVLLISGFGNLSHTHCITQAQNNHAYSHPVSIDKHWQQNWPDWRGQWLNVIGCHLSNKSVCYTSPQLEPPQSTVSAVIMKWKCLGVKPAQPWSGGHAASQNETPPPDSLADLVLFDSREHCLL